MLAQLLMFSKQILHTAFWFSLSGACSGFCHESGYSKRPLTDHWGLSSDMKMYIQETTGHAGRDSMKAKASLYYNTHDVSESITCKTSREMLGIVPCVRENLKSLIDDAVQVKTLVCLQML